MYLSLNCLKDFIKIPKNIEAKDIAKLLTMHTVEVESWRLQKDDFKNIVVAKVLSVSAHPNADKLSLVDLDAKKDTLKVVCGATNLKQGQKVALALPGAKLMSGLEIEETEIRGQKSQGMICSEDELGLGGEAEGIMVLSNNAKIGQSLADYLELNDVIFEIDNKSLSHRGDLWGHYGMARELSTILKVPLKEYLEIDDKIFQSNNDEQFKVKVEDKDVCSRYIAVKINKVKNIESPAWLKNRLMAMGVRPINVLVDISNYVMFELGQPLHIFDARNIEKIVVRKSKNEESIETLDGKERLLPKNAVVISDGQDPIAIAGIMGGLKSAVKDDMNSIILESANFDAVSVRQTSQFLNLRTDASMRFEKTLDPQICLPAWQRAWQLIKEIMPEAEIDRAMNDVSSFSLEEKIIELDFNWLKKRMGHEISKNEAVNILKNLGFEIEIEKNIFTVKVPSWRGVKDIASKEDLLEEVARIVGYENIPFSLPIAPLEPPKQDEERNLAMKVQDILSGPARLNEVYNYSFVSEQMLAKLNLDFTNYLKLVNPISENHSLLRQNLLIGLLMNARVNQFNQSSFGLFEIGRIFLPVPGGYLKGGAQKDEQLPYQGKRLGILVASSEPDQAFKKLKGIVQFLFSSLWADLSCEFVLPENDFLWSRKNRSANIFIDDRELGFVSEIDNRCAKNFNLKINVAIAEINFEELLFLFKKYSKKQYRPLSKYPHLTRDIAFVLDEKVLYNDFRKELLNFHPLLVAADLFDVYHDNSLGENLKSWAFHLTYQDKSHTLQSEEVDKIQQKLIEHLRNQFEAQIRS